MKNFKLLIILTLLSLPNFINAQILKGNKTDSLKHKIRNVKLSTQEKRLSYTYQSLMLISGYATPLFFNDIEGGYYYNFLIYNNSADEFIINRNQFYINLRRNFKRSAFEIGLQKYNTSSIHYISINNQIYTHIDKRNYLIGKINYTQYPLKHFKKFNLNPYLGLALNFDIGHALLPKIGGILGIDYNLYNNRIFLNLRYEKSSITNQIQIGIRIRYQKENMVDYLMKKNKVLKPKRIKSKGILN